MSKLPKRKKDFCSFDTFSRKLSKYLLLKSVRSIEKCLYMLPTIMYDFLGFNKKKTQIHSFCICLSLDEVYVKGD